MATADFKKLSRHELSLSKTQPGQGDGLVFDSGKSFSQNAAKIVFGETEQFSAGMPLTNSFLFLQGTSFILFNFPSSWREVKSKSALRGVPHSSLHRQLPEGFASTLRGGCESSFGKCCSFYSSK
jgi:hypothetical protein